MEAIHVGWEFRRGTGEGWVEQIIPELRGRKRGASVKERAKGIAKANGGDYT